MLRQLLRFLNVLVFALLACHSPSGAPAPMQDSSEEIVIDVVNRNRLDVIVFVVHDGISTRLGLATASTTTELKMPLRLLGAGREYRLVGHPIGMRINVRTETLHALAGDEVTWSLEDSFSRSTVVVR